MISRLYIKIFLFFIVLLVVAGVLVGILFHMGPERSVRKRLERTGETLALMTGDVIRKHLTGDHEEPVSENKGLIEAVNRLADIWESRVWLTGPDGETEIKTFEGAPPEGPIMVPRNRFKTTSRAPVYAKFLGRQGFHVAFPLETEKGTIGIHVLFRRGVDEHDARGFFIGLFIIGLIIAAIVFPISRTITKPVNRLRNSALRIAEGDLSHRADVRTKDEIGSLGRAFNTMADKVERMVRGGRELTANMSHELRTPLARIRVAGELLEQKLEKIEDPGIQKYLGSIMEDVNELDRLIGRLLDLSKQDLREGPLRLESVNFSELLSEFLDRYDTAFKARSLTLETALPDSLVVRIDTESIKTALSAVMDNAVRFSPKGERIRVAVFVEDGWIVTRLANRTAVWPEGDFADLFEPFHRASRDSGGGYGLGLAISNKIIEKQGGLISAQRDGDWFVMEIRLPAESPIG